MKWFDFIVNFFRLLKLYLYIQRYLNHQTPVMSSNTNDFTANIQMNNQFIKLFSSMRRIFSNSERFSSISTIDRFPEQSGTFHFVLAICVHLTKKGINSPWENWVLYDFYFIIISRHLDKLNSCINVIRLRTLCFFKSLDCTYSNLSNC